MKFTKTAQQLLLGVLAVVFISSCNQFSLAYRFADWIFAYQLDHYFDLDFTQEEWTDEVIDEWHLWHRTNELPQYADLLGQAQQRVRRGLVAEDLVWLRQEGLEVQRRLVKRTLPEIATFLYELKPEQVENLKIKLAERRQERDEDYTELTHAEWREQRIERFIDNMEDWIEDLTEEQKAIIEKQDFWNKEIVTIFRERRNENRKRFFDTLANAQSKTELEQAFFKQWTDPAAFYGPVYKAWVEQRWLKTRDFTLELDASFSEEQRDYLIQSLEKYRQILLDLTT